MTTINYCGDSFCANYEEPFSWPVVLAKSLDATILGFGKDGSAHEHAISCFDSSADITIFCWTEAHRIYHKDWALNTASAFDYHTETHDAAKLYYKHLHDWGLQEKRQMRDLYWFDHEVLSKYSGTCIHLWCFRTTYQFTHGYQFSMILNNLTTNKKPKANHLSKENNLKLAQSLKGIINGKTKDTTLGS